MNSKSYIVNTDYPVRVDSYIAALDCELTRSAAAQLISAKNVFVNGKTVSKSCLIENGDSLVINLPEPVSDKALPENIPLDIVYEDSELLVVNKPKGMVVHPACGNYTGTLVNALLYHCGDSLSGINGVIRPGIVHRIDKNTSGLLIVAKNDNAHCFLAKQISAHSFLREYEAVVCGSVRDDCGTVNQPIGRHPVHRKMMAVTPKNSKIAITNYKVLCRYEKYTHLRLTLQTGRTHQIRVHMEYLHHPVAGDTLYGGGKIAGLDEQCLHAKTIGFVHPDGRYMEFTSPLPDYFTSFLERIN